jgi:hypothetical protein
LALGKPFPPVEISYKTKLHEVVDVNSHLVFQILKINFGWLAAPVSEWSEFVEFQKLEAFVKSTVVVNDEAERGCNLASTHGGIITCNEENQQGLFHTVKRHRRACPTITKKT